MKRLISFLLSLMLLMSSLPFAVAEEEAKVGLPNLGDVVEGFEVTGIREFPLIGATLVLFEHQKTGAGLTYIANEDVNRAFDLTFLTRPLDDTGLPHVFEHATLDGSDKYPSKALFFNLIYQTYNTYLNASTHSVMTTYPMASLSEAQLLRYADYYTDSCLHPMLMTDESIFREEAWRYRMESLEDDLTIEGTVYSEMLGATTLNRKASMNNYQVTFPGSVVGFDQGGNPDVIPEMTYESLKSYHERFYHPSNCMAYLYGDFTDYTAFLRLLNEAFSPYEKAEFVFEDSGYTRITEPVTAEIGFPMEAGASTDHTSTIYYSFVCPGLRDNAEEELVANTLTDLLIADSSPLMQALKKALPWGDFACYIDTSAPDDALMFYAVNVNPEDAEVFKATIDTVLAQLAEEGLSQTLVDTVMASIELTTMLITETKSLGVNVITSLAYSFATTGDAFDYLNYVDALSKMDDWNAEGRYVEAIRTWLSGNNLTSLVTTYPMPGEKEVRDAALAEKLAAIKAGMTEVEQQAIVDQTNAVEAEEDTTEMVASLQAVTVASLPEEIREYEILDETDENGVRHLDAVAQVDGIGETCILLDASGIAQSDLHYFKLLTDLIGELDTDRHTKEEMDVLTERYLYDGEIRLSAVKDETEGYNPYLHLSWTAREDDLETGYAIMDELIFSTQFTDAAKVLEQVQAAKASLRSQINSSGYNIMLYRAGGVTDPRLRYVEYCNYLAYYDFLVNAEATLQENPDVVLEGLRRVQTQLRNASNAVTMFAGNNEGIAVNRKLADAFLAGLGYEPIERVSYDLPVPEAHEALILDSNVQFNSVLADYATLGMEGYDASISAILNLVSDNFLVPLLRDQYGVYTPLAGAGVDIGVYLLTYRDPNIVQTFQVYESLPELVAGMEVDQDTLDGYILSTYSGYAQPAGELSGAMTALSNHLSGRAQEQTLAYMRELKAVTPEKVQASAEIFKLLVEKGVRDTAGSASAISANAELYDAILNPFNAVDTSSVTLEDVEEGSEHYAAVRFAYENGLLAPLGDTAFGTDEAATVGDLAGALYVVLGGAPNMPEEAVATLAAYGILSPDLTAETVLTNGLSDEIFVTFGAAVGWELQADEPNETTDLPQTRGELAEGLYMLFGE